MTATAVRRPAVTATQRDGILELRLDTPGSPVNIFTHELALELMDVLEAVDPADTTAVIFRTAKKGSFVNGAGLLLSTVARSLSGLIEVAQPIRDAYRAVRRCPLPTIAVVEGLCWGCGLEFLLNCRHRIAADTADTEFRMTELVDYNDMTGFGATSHLPLELGLP